MGSLARALERHLRQDNRFPAPLAWLPARARIRNSEVYVAAGYLGYSALRSAFAAAYERAGRFEMFIIPCATPAAARTMLEGYLSAQGKRASVTGEGTQTVRDPNNGPVGLILRGNILAGVVNVSQDQRRRNALRELAAALPGRRHTGHDSSGAAEPTQ